ncbi:MAG TPA: DUF192 domain-containing protein [Candidatus Limnocylindria bacterium]|nr:DUF192 domain-containing protein [Candidatus Limnocylindria bacterium]
MGASSVGRSTRRVRNQTRGTVLATRCAVADSFFTRAFGLIPRARLADGEGLLITRTSTITMWLMRFPIDAVFIDRSGRVVRVAADLPPWRFAVAARGAQDVLELPSGTAARTGTQAGDELLIEPG